MFKNKFKPAHELRRKISIITVCALLVTVLCGSALLGGCKKTPAISNDVNSLVSGVSDDKNNSVVGENSGDTVNTDSQATETTSGSKEPGNVTGDNNTHNNNTVSTPESESKAPESAATDDKTSNPQQQFKYYIQKLDEYGKTVRQTDYYEEKSTTSIADVALDEKTMAATVLQIAIRHQYSYPRATVWGENTGWTLEDFKCMSPTRIESSCRGVTGNMNEYIVLYFDNSTPEQVLEYGKELEKYECVKYVMRELKGIPN